MLIKEFNLDGLNSLFIDTFDDESYNEIDIPLKVTKKQLNDFNKRIVNIENFNKVIEIFDYFNIDELEEFIISNFQNKGIFILNEEHTGKISSITLDLINQNVNIKDTDLNNLIKLDADKWIKCYTDKGESMKRTYFDLALKYFSYKCVKFYIEKGIYYDKDAIIDNTFKKINYFEELDTCIRCYKLLEYFINIDCTLSKDFILKVIENKSTLCYIYLKSNKLIHPTKNNKSFSIKWLDAQKPNLDFFKIFHNFTEKIYNSEYSYSLKNRKFDCFNYIYEKNLDYKKKYNLPAKPDVNSITLSEAVISNNLEIVKLIYNNDGKIRLDVFENALFNNNKEIFYYLYNESLKHPEKTLFKYKKIQFNFVVLKCAIKYEYLDIVKIVLDHQYFESNLLQSLHTFNLDIFKLLVQHGLILDDNYIHNKYYNTEYNSKSNEILEYIFKCSKYKISLKIIERSFTLKSDFTEYLIDNYEGDVRNEDEFICYLFNSSIILKKLLEKFKNKIVIHSILVRKIIENNDELDTIENLKNIITYTSYKFTNEDLITSILHNKYDVAKLIVKLNPKEKFLEYENFMFIFQKNNLNMFKIICNSKTDIFQINDNMFIDCIKYSDVNFLKYLYYYCANKMIPVQGRKFIELWTKKGVIYNCILHNKLDCFKFAIDKDSIFDENIITDLIKIKHDITEFIDYLNKDMKKIIVEKLLKIDNIISLLIEHGNLCFLKMMYSNDYKYDVYVAIKLLQNNHFECFDFVIENDNLKNNKLICEEAVKNNSLKQLKYAHEKKCAWDWNVCMEAVKNGNLKCLKYAYENGCELSSHLIEFICNNCNKYFKKYIKIRDLLIDIKCPIDAKIIIGNNYSHIDLDSKENISNDVICTYFASLGELELLKYAHDSGFIWDEKTVYYANKYEYYNCLNYAIDNGCEYNKEIYERSKKCNSEKTKSLFLDMS